MSPSFHQGSGSLTQVLEQIRRCAASVTRYPLDILTAEAQLEDELGIDSVKLAEIAAVVAREFNLAADRLPRGAKARTLGAISERVVELLAEGAPASVVAPIPPAATAPVAAPAPVAVPPRVVSPASMESSDLESQVRSVFARVTRYPVELLTLEADLEDELGIDSVKQAEVLAVLVKELGLEVGPKPSQRLRTLSAICEAIRASRGTVTAPRHPVEESVRASPPPVVARLPFEGKVALITGSGKGIGKVVAMRLASAGATVVVNSFHSRDEGERTAQEIVAAGGKALHLWGSVAQEEHLERLFSSIEERLGGLDFLVCNASNGLIGPFDRIAPRDWDKAFRTCVTGTYECAMRARPLMARRGGGAIVTMSTSMSQRYMHDLGCQGVVKAGVESLTRYLAAELAPEGIRTNCVSAGPVHGELLGMFPNAPGRVSRWEAATPGGQLCTADDVADVTELLLGPKTQRVNGAIWVVDGGLSGTVDGLLPVGRQPSNGHDVRALLALDS
ncbi:SDR family oxidoreductase [Myxococcus llanfairpwllgwyngyllgogerychwyrndrobwllllantysiliogogogochensis]|uniref:SDR family oxidoreductase n=1 Tax=Myxococcus llanfairpwllgwyngyllgogerychwyrndrobwllllantysiliogogogochensis TaxID=2590453 RepID=A0A540X7L2_9BACT|nr:MULTISPECIES: SDR family oxidoreductase [Myxococcus]NTX55048.1 SDR family oxidoreductase [Myxococcus sp. CA039A]TQF17283.1 SDR family oxidoreductase [Myxococcus llanfairpwllgwyngyllgogerychwyrndrobwllllantysiliogogogochensis]